MRALVTGASSGIGYEMAKILDKKGYDVVITGRRQEKLIALAEELTNDTQMIVADLSKREECMRLIQEAGEVDIVINNAGTGVHGAFAHTSLEDELKMLDTNIIALHILTKHYYQYLKEKGSGYLMNIASSAAFFAGPYFSSYYASKAYVFRLTQALWKENQQNKGNISISVFCPGPVDTEFNQKANVLAPMKGISAKWAAQCAIEGMFQKKRMITPGIGTRLSYTASKILPDRLALEIVSMIQKKKMG